MRWMTRRLADERGASAVLVGILLLVLVGFGALAVDVGAMYSERAQLQNAADAGALAAAEYCGAHNGCAATADKSAATAAALAVTGGNMVDGENTTAAPTYTADTVRVVTSTPAMAHPLAAALGLASSDVGAAAKAKWTASAVAAGTVPFAISECATTPGAVEFVEIRKDKSCAGMIPGGFGWLENATGTCVMNITLNEFTEITTGNTAKCHTNAAELNAMAAHIGCNLNAEPVKSAGGMDEKFFLCLTGKTVLVPVFSDKSKCAGLPAGKEYCITKFAAYELKGLHIKDNGGTKVDYCTISDCDFPKSWGVLGFTGKFITYVTAEDNWYLGAAGTPSVRLIG
ncbi:pilus assembly protein TadG-related protein [Agromyces sp. MMS24-JH15]|uniref:pilus assembly protein TadG-related protein n=1 Tax=Agromyces sp. MMS24-JH15 TaxID=3243765 RepID=UPI0037478E1B